MKVRGVGQQVSTEEYVEQATRELAARLTAALSDLGEDAVVPPIDVLSENLDGLVMTVTGPRNELADLLGPFWSGQRTREALRVNSRQVLGERRKAGTLLGLPTSDGSIVYPTFQFERRDGVIEVKPGLRGFLRALRSHDAWAVAVVTRTPVPELGGRTPLDWVRSDGDPSVLAALGGAVAHEWSR